MNYRHMNICSRRSVDPSIRLDPLEMETKFYLKKEHIQVYNQLEMSDSSPLGKVCVGIVRVCHLDLLFLLLQQQLYHSVLLIKQLPDVVVVFTQAALQADSPSLRLDMGAQTCKGVMGGSTQNTIFTYQMFQKIKVIPVLFHGAFTGWGFTCLMKHCIAVLDLNNSSTF